MGEQIQTVDTRTSDYGIIKGYTLNMRSDLNSYVNYQTVNPRRPVLKLGVPMGSNDPYVRVSKDVAFLEDIPIYNKVDSKPASSTAFINEYYTQDDDGFYHANKNLMINCYMTSGQYRAISFKIAKDEVINDGVYLYQEAGFSQSNVYTVTQWLLPNGPYSSTIYKTQLNFSSSGVTRTSDLNVSYTWDLYVG